MLKERIRQFKPPVMLCLAFLLAALFLLIGSKSSPLYPMNDWVDVNVFMTLGRGILHGKVPYRDLFEQKGPFLFFWHALSALFIRRGYGGVWLSEILTVGLFLYYCARITGLYVKNRLAPILIMMILGVGVTVSPAFSMGGGLEELFLFAFPLSLFYLLRGIREKRPLSFRESFVIGLMAGIGFWTKYTFCGFFAALALAVVIWYASSRLIGSLYKTAGQMILGLLAVTLPILLYFALNGALDDLFHVYFLQNIRDYARTEKSALEYIKSGLQLTYKRNLWNYNWLLWPGAAFLLFGLYRHWRETLAVLLSFAGLAVTTYMSSPGYIYYGLSFAPYALCGLVGIAWLAEKILTARLSRGTSAPPVRIPKSARILLGFGLPILAGVGMAVIGVFSSNTYLMKFKKEDMPQYQFAEIIQEKEDATLLNYWFLDGGFYYASGVEPVNKYFCYFNLNPPELKTDQEDLIRSGGVDFVVTRRNPLPNRLLNDSSYELVAQSNFFFSTRYYDYYLYRLKESP